MQCLVAQSCLTLCQPWQTVACQAPLPMGILQARILEWVAMPSSRKNAIEYIEWKAKKEKKSINTKENSTREIEMQKS